MAEEDIGLDPETIQGLLGKGQLDKDFLDSYYQDLQTQDNEEQASDVLDQATTSAANEILRDPQARAIANIVSKKVAEAASGPSPQTLPAPEEVSFEGQLPVATAGSPTPTPIPRESLITANNPAVAQAVEASEVGDQIGVNAALEQAVQMKRAGLAAEAGAIQREALASNQALSAADKALSSKAEELALKRSQYENVRDEQLQKQIDVVNQYNTLDLNPDRFWASRSTGQKVLIGLGMALSGFAGSDKAMNVIQNAIDDDIKLQKDQASLKGQGIAYRSNLIGQMQDVVKDESDAERLARAAIFDHLKLKLEALANTSKSQTASARAQQLGAELTMKSQSLKEQVAGNTDNQIASMQDAVAEATGKIPTIRTDRDYAAAVLDKGWVPGVGVANNEVTARKQAAALPRIQALIKKLNQLEGIVDTSRPANRTTGEGVGVEVFPTIAAKKAMTIRGAILGDIKELEELGALDKGVDAFGAKLLPEDPTGGIFTGIGNVVMGNRTLAQIQQYRDVVMQSYAGRLRSNFKRLTPEYANIVMENKLRKNES